GLLVADAGTGNLALIAGGLARPLGTGVYQYLGSPPSTSISADQLAAIPAGPVYYPDGMVVRAAAGTLAVIDGGLARPLGAGVYQRLGSPPEAALTDAQFAAIPAGPTYYPEGMVVLSPAGALAIIAGGLARPLGAGIARSLGN